MENNETMSSFRYDRMKDSVCLCALLCPVLYNVLVSEVFNREFLFYMDFCAQQCNGIKRVRVLSSGLPHLHI